MAVERGDYNISKRSDTLNFEKLDLEHLPLFQQYKHLANPISSVHNFTAVYSWRKGFGMEICHEGNALILRRTTEPLIGYLPVLAESDEDFINAIKNLETHSKKTGYPFQFVEAEEWFLKRLDSLNISYEKEYDQDSSEYLYLGEKIRTLSGKKMHSKKNHYNRFVKNINYEVKNLKDHQQEALDMGYRWLADKEDEHTRLELEGMKDIFKHMDVLPVKGITVFVDGICQGFTISEDVEGGAIVHIEKANDEIRGMFTFVNSENQKINHPEAELVNREQDLGIEGLRKAKLSWKPTAMVDKYTVKIHR